MIDLQSTTLHHWMRYSTDTSSRTDNATCMTFSNIWPTFPMYKLGHLLVVLVPHLSPSFLSICSCKCKIVTWPTFPPSQPCTQYTPRDEVFGVTWYPVVFQHSLGMCCGLFLDLIYYSAIWSAVDRDCPAHWERIVFVKKRSRKVFTDGGWVILLRWIFRMC